MFKLVTLFSSKMLYNVKPLLMANMITKFSFSNTSNPLKVFESTKNHYVLSLNKKTTTDQWNHIIEACDPISKSIITKINSIDSYKLSEQSQMIGQINKQISTYLNYDSLGIHDNRTIAGLCSLLLAFQQTSIQEFKNNKSRLVEFMVLQNISSSQDKFLKINETEYNQKLIKLIFEAYVVKTITCQSKNLKTKYQNHAINFFLKVFPIINRNLWTYFLLGINTFKSKLSVLSTFRLIQAAQMVENAVFSIIKNESKDNIQNLKFIFGKQFLVLMEDISFTSYQNAKFFAETIIKFKYMQQIYQNKYMCQKWARIYISFPNYLPNTKDPIFKSSVNAKDIIYAQFEKIYNTNHIFRSEFASIPENLKGLIFKAIIQSKFYTMFYQLPFEAIGTQTIVRQLKLVPPSLGDFAWNIFFQTNGTLNGSIYYVAKKIYPHKVKVDFKVSKQLFYDKVIIDNETNYKINAALDSLGISYLKDYKIQQKPVDYYIPQMRVIIQMDGDIHEQIRTGEPNVKTCFRNLSFMLMGYRVIILTLHEYNSYRQTQSFRQLIAKKLKLVKEYNAIYVY